MIRSDGTLYIPLEWEKRSPNNGRFLKGHQPANKGRKWSEWMSEEGARNSSKGWSNLEKYRNINGRADNAGRCRKEVVAVRNNGEFRVFDYILAAAEWIGGIRENVGRCCRENQARHVNRKTGRVNTDHQYKGVRFYFSDDPIWMDKIGHSII